MAGIYVHVPFCRQACHYCNFHFSTNLNSRNDFISALLNEIDLRSQYLSGQQVSTIYFGGGTPSLLPENDIARILDKIYSAFPVAPDPEITLEANPDDLSRRKLEELRSTGINRLSIGIQSFFEDDLRWMNRAHSADQSLSCLREAQDVGFSNLSIDLIYGTPGLTDEKWFRNVRMALDLGIPHLSCYALTVEPKTALHHFVKTNQVNDVDADQQARQFLSLIEWTTSAGYEHYEISNFSKPGWRSRHNTSYWQGKHYIGLGPSAHSFNGVSRQWNIANNALYIASVNGGKVPFETEELTLEQRLNEYIMTSLRTIEGLDTNYVSENFSESESTRIINAAEKFIAAGNLALSGDRLFLTTQGKFLADGIAAELFAG